jgi:hypothetical protein
MAEVSSVHSYLNWTRQRIDEIEATLASLESEASRMNADSKAKADQFISDLKKQRDEFQAKAKDGIRAAETALEAAKTQLESQWPEFESQVNAYFETTARRIEQRQAAFRDVGAAQMKAWLAAAASLRGEATNVAAARRGEVEAAVEQMKENAAQAEARLQKLRQAGGESWAAMSAALADSRNAFDRASQAAWAAVKRAQT